MLSLISSEQAHTPVASRPLASSIRLHLFAISAPTVEAIASSLSTILTIHAASMERTLHPCPLP